MVMPLILQSTKWFKTIIYCYKSIMLIFIFIYSVYFVYKDKSTIIKTSQIYEDKIIDLKDFKYLINNDICNEETDINILGILLVTSYIGNEEMRMAHRNAISQKTLKQMSLLRIFVIAAYPYSDTTIQEDLISEKNMFNDLIQGNFMDTYRNLTYKIAMGLKWATTKCSKAKYIIKVDDDTVFDIYHVKTFLENFKTKLGNITEFIAGRVQRMVISRDKSDKYFVTRDEYDKDTTPPYTIGWLYITNQRTAKSLVNTANNMKYFWIEDVFFTGFIRLHKKIRLYDIGSWFTIYRDDLYCCLNIMKKFNYKCSYYIGSSQKDNADCKDIDLLGNFLKATKKCYQDECIERPKDMVLKGIC